MADDFGREAVTIMQRRRTKADQASARKRAAPSMRVSGDADKPRPTAPTAKMVAYAQSLALGKNVALPEGYERDFKARRRFLDEHAR
jgi:DNA topoisomerase III